MEFERALVPVSVMETAMLVVAPGANVEGFGVVDDLNARFEFTVIVAAEEFQLHVCHVELNTPISTVYVPDSEGTKLTEKGATDSTRTFGQ
jgi:hypothetical protein